MMIRSSRPRGMTLVEILVVITIIGVLIGLLLPAVQRARETARQVVCSNNFKQLGLANHNYLDAKRVFPPGGRGYGFQSAAPTATYVADETITNMNGMLYLLPGIEEADLFARFDFDAAFGNYNALSGKPLASPNAVASGNAALTAKLIPTLICPSDTGTRYLPKAAGSSGNQSPEGSSTGTVTPSRTSYEFVSDHDEFRYYNLWRVAATNARYMFGENSTTTTSKVADGLSKTLMMGERTFATVNGTGYTGNWAYRGYQQVGVDPVGTYCTATVPKKGLNIWVNGANPMKLGTRGCWYVVASLHPKGCNFVFADGSVRFVSETIDDVMLGYLCTIADGYARSISMGD